MHGITLEDRHMSSVVVGTVYINRCDYGNNCMIRIIFAIYLRETESMDAHNLFTTLVSCYKTTNSAL